MNLTFIENYENAVPDDLCDEIIKALEDMLDTDNHSISYMEGSTSNQGYENRQDYSYGFEVTHPALTERVNAYLQEYVADYCEKYPSYGMNPSMSRNCKVQKTFPKGGFHRWHCENGYGNWSEARTLTWTIYLNDVPDGEGETEFIELGVKVKPKKGSLCFFPASWTHTHRGNPVYTCNKYIATGWYYLA